MVNLLATLRKQIVVLKPVIGSMHIAGTAAAKWRFV